MGKYLKYQCQSAGQAHTLFWVHKLIEHFKIRASGNRYLNFNMYISFNIRPPGSNFYKEITEKYKNI